MSVHIPRAVLDDLKFLRDIVRKRKSPVSATFARNCMFSTFLSDIDPLHTLPYGWKLFSTSKFDKVYVSNLNAMIKELEQRLENNDAQG